MRILTTQQFIDSWCQIVLDLLDLTFAELFLWISTHNCMDCCMDSTKNTLKLGLQWILSQLPSDLHILQW